MEEIKVPVPTAGAKYDLVNPENMKWMSTQVQNDRYLYCPGGSHLAMWDDRKDFYAGIIKFIRDVDDGTFKSEK